MPLAAGTTLGPYEILSPLGAGGMGEVYKARDTRLDRTVAIKVISSLLAGTPELRERFDREARAISQLNHPHICTLHDVGHDRGVDYLVLEYLEGETLADRLEANGGGPLPLSGAIQIAMQICDALDKAHRHGIVHRDLKPANVFLTRSGGTSRAAFAKLLDFGLAKTVALAPAPASLMRTSPATAQGTVIGTLQYMSPEQAEGREADARSDIFAFGAMLYEMVTGRRAFGGETPASVMTAILRDTPPPIADLVPIAPRALDRVVGRCLEKDPDDRWQSARDVLLVLRDLGSGQEESARRPAARVPFAIASAIAALAIGAAAWLWATRPPPPTAQPVRLSVLLPEGYDFRSDTPELAFSPDGRHLAMALSGEDGIMRIFLRSLDTPQVRPLAGTEGGAQPFWSPDGRNVAFFAGGRLKRVDLAGGPVQTVCDAAEARGGAWGAEDVILFTPNPSSGILRVAAGGGQPQPLTRPATPRESHRYPAFLQDGRRFLYVAIGPEVAVYSASVDGGAPTRVLEADSRAFYAGGNLLFARAGVLMAQPFDERTLRFTGEAHAIAEEVDAGGPPGAGAFTVSADGVVGYVAGARRRARDLVWRQRGQPEPTRFGDTQRYLTLSLSPDDRRLAVAIEDRQDLGSDLWLMNVARGVGARLRLEGDADWFPVWSRDGRRLIFRNGRSSGTAHVIDRRMTGQERVIQHALFPTSITPDGATIIGHEVVPQTGWDILALTGDALRPVVAGPYTDVSGMLSPDGRWLLWSSDESGAFEVYIARYPDLSDKQRVSAAGGSQPAWRGDSRELFYVAANSRLVAVEVTTAAEEIDLGQPKTVFSAPLAAQTSPFYNKYAVTSDGLRFVTMEPPPHSPPVSVGIYTGLAASGRQ